MSFNSNSFNAMKTFLNKKTLIFLGLAATTFLILYANGSSIHAEISKSARAGGG